MEKKTKELGCIIVVSAEVIEHAGEDFSRFPSQVISLQGKQQSVRAYLVKNPPELSITG